MISLKKYLDTVGTGFNSADEAEEGDLVTITVSAYRSSLLEMGNCSLDACPGLGSELKQSLGKLEARLSAGVTRETVEATESGVQQQLQDWGRRTALHYRQKAGEVKEILLVMARTAESVGARDQRCAQQFDNVTMRLKKIANLEDLTEIRASIESSAAELKASIDRMTAEGKAAIDQLRAEVTTFQTRLEEAEQVASSDSLTGLRNRLAVEGHLERRLAAGTPFCAAIIDIDRFKQVNDRHGHVAGDELLRQFAVELRSACRSKDIVGRWGGDEFIILLDCTLTEAKAQIDRLSAWVCGSYKLEGASGPLELKVSASIGFAESKPNEAMKGLLARADAEMYRQKAAARARLQGAAEQGQTA
jgi:diguanylate cyclase (GGDEF)-like protein